MKKQTLSEIIEEQKDIFNLEDSYNMKKRLEAYLKPKFKEAGIWDNASKRKVAKTMAREFNPEDVEGIINSSEVQGYFIKQMGGHDAKEIQKKIEENRVEAEYHKKKLDGSLTEKDIREHEKYQENRRESEFSPSYFEIQQVMVSALFNQFFELDLEKWTRDNEFVQQTLLDRDNDPDNITNTKFIIAFENLQDPLKSYVKPKNKKNN